MRLQAGGVGFYPTGNTPWVHIDSGSVRYWPRMSHDQIARLFPDGKTVFIPSDGVPLPGYQQAAAEIEARGGAVYAATAEPGTSKSLFAMLFGGEDDAEEGGGSRGGGAMITASNSTPIASGRGGQSPQAFFMAQNQSASGAPDTVSRAKRDLPRGETFMRAPDVAPAATVASASQKPQVPASLERPVANDADAANASGASAAQWVAPLPPHRPTEFLTADAGLAETPTPPSRPVEFAALQPPNTTLTRSLAPLVPDSQAKNDQIAALLARKLPSAITKGVAVPPGTLALLEVNAPEPPERPATLARAAALSAQLPPSRRAPKAVLVAAKIDRSDFSAMTAAPENGHSQTNAGARIAPIAPTARSDELMAMLAPNVQGAGAFAAQPYGDLRSDAFTGPAVRPLGDAMAAGQTASLRGSSD
jgi:hypothetical protein